MHARRRILRFRKLSVLHRLDKRVHSSDLATWFESRSKVMSSNNKTEWIINELTVVKTLVSSDGVSTDAAQCMILNLKSLPQIFE